MSRYKFTTAAERDLWEIWTYIAGDNSEVADRVEEAVHDACAFLSVAPHCGHTRTDITKQPVRFWTLPRYPKYVIIYDPAAQPLRILRILNWARNLRAILRRAQ